MQNKTITGLLIYLSSYCLIGLMILYVLVALIVEKREKKSMRGVPYFRHFLIILLMHAIGMGTLFLNNPSVRILNLAGFQIAVFFVVWVLFSLFYRKGSSRALLNHMLLLTSIGMTMITRINPDRAEKQSIIFAAAAMIFLLLPVMIRKMRFFEDMGIFFAGVGIVLLFAVLVLATVTYGAKMSISVGGFTVQPSEFIKISFVFAVAGLLNKRQDFRAVVIATVLAAVHVGLLVVSTDLGSAVIFFAAYLIMLYTATGTGLYSIFGLICGAIASVGAYYVFGHVRVRVQVWMNPFQDYQSSGYQICQSLFSYGAGGWWGTGLTKGSPTAIPFVEQDFMFSAIAEELGSVFCILMLVVYYFCIRSICRLSRSLRSTFYRIIAIGIATELTCQIFLTIGGGIKMIPLTGVTLPLVSYGGSSIASTVLMFGIIQGICYIRKDEGDRIETERFEETLPEGGIEEDR